MTEHNDWIDRFMHYHMDGDEYSHFMRQSLPLFRALVDCVDVLEICGMPGFEKDISYYKEVIKDSTGYTLDEMRSRGTND